MTESRNDGMRGSCDACVAFLIGQTRGAAPRLQGAGRHEGPRLQAVGGQGL